jgi:hypothetical protein
MQDRSGIAQRIGSWLWIAYVLACLYLTLSGWRAMGDDPQTDCERDARGEGV